jgi:hypothetical protein
LGRARGRDTGVSAGRSLLRCSTTRLLMAAPGHQRHFKHKPRTSASPPIPDVSDVLVVPIRALIRAREHAIESGLAGARRNFGGGVAATFK